MSALVGALRGGNTADRLLSIAQGMTTDDLVGAYDYLEHVRREACRALDALFDEPTARRFAVVRRSIDTLFPAVAASLAAIASDDPDRFAAAVNGVRERSNDLAREVEWIESMITAGDIDPRAAHARLDDGRSGGLHHDPAYIPVRIGDLTPRRVAALLGESIELVRR